MESGGHNNKLLVPSEVQIEMDFTHQTGKSQQKLQAMTTNRTLRNVDNKYRKREPHHDAPDYQLQRIKYLATNQIFQRTQNTVYG